MKNCVKKIVDKKIRYIGYYDILHNGKKVRNYSLAAARKMDYICTAIKDIGFDVEILSPAYSILSGHGFIPSETLPIAERTVLKTTPSLKASNKLARILRVLMAQLWLFFYLMGNCHKDEKVIVYHNYNLAIPLLMAKFFKRFELILEIEEIYDKVWKLTSYQRIREKWMLKQANDHSLVVSDVLKDELSLRHGIVSYGSYSVYKGDFAAKKTDKTLLVFTGSIDRERGGGFISIEAMRYLPENYQLFLSGVIAEKDKKDFLKRMDEINAELNREACQYVGILSDEDYENLLLNADIALNPQKDGIYGKYVFPSKILTYMSYGLPVVSTKGESIVKSQLADLITLASDYDPKSVAEAIMNVEMKPKSVYIQYLEKLDHEFKDRLRDLLSHRA